MDVEHELRAKIIVDFLKDHRPGYPLVGIELGIYIGDLVVCLLELEPRISKIYGVDPFIAGSGYKGSQEQWDIFYRKALENLWKYGDRVTIIRDKSQNVSDLFPMVDFVELDGNHTYDQVSFEIEVYEKKIKSGGMLCGHDYFGRYNRPVKKAVRDYARFHKRDVQASETNENLGMWWWRVP